MTTTLELASFLNALDATPECRTTAGALADYLDEQQQDSPWVTCPKCKGEKVLPKRPEFPVAKCRHCSGTGSVQDRDLANRAEYIRLGLECGQGVLGYESKDQQTCSVLDVRRTALLKDNSSCTSLPCPGCKGKGMREPRGFLELIPQPCSTCGGSGDLLNLWGDPNPGGPPHEGVCPLPRIDPARHFYAGGVVPFVRLVGCAVEELGTMVERGSCRQCNGTGQVPVYTGHGDHRIEDCWECGGGGEPLYFRPSPWAAAVARKLPYLRGFDLEGLEPYWNGTGYCWFLDDRPQPSGAVPAASELPGFLFNAVEGFTFCAGVRFKGFATRDLAVSAAQRAALAVVKGATPPC